MPPLAAVIALQLLAVSGPPPGARQVIGLLGVMFVASVLGYAVATVTVGNTFLYAIGTGLLYLWGFFVAVRPKTAAAGIMFLTMTVVVTTLSAVSTGVAGFLVIELLISVVIGIGLVFLAHVAVPHVASGATLVAAAAASRAFLPAGQHAVLATLVIVPVHLLLTADGFAAIVVLLTVSTMLCQRGVTQSFRYGVSFACGNLLGGALAWVAVTIASLHDTMVVPIVVTAAGALLMAELLVRSPAWSQVLLPGFVAFVLLFGVAFAPLPLGEDVAVLKRVGQIVLAMVYALCALSLFLPLVRYRGAGRDASWSH